MDFQEQKIAEGLRKIAQQYGGGGLLQGATVKTVHADKFTCDVETDNEDELPGVLYKSVSGGNVDVIFQPAVDSKVFIMQIADSDEWVVLKFGTIDKVFIKVGDSSLLITTDSIEMNGGSLGGMVKLEALVSVINAIKADLNNLKTAFNSWTPVPSDGGAALKTIAATWTSSHISNTTNSDLENTKVKQ